MNPTPLDPTGTWELVIRTPIGKQRVTLTIVESPAGLTGTAAGSQETVPLSDLTLDGRRLTWTQSITKPMRLNLAFDLEIDGDALQGTSKAGRLPSSKVTGRRVQPVP